MNNSWKALLSIGLASSVALFGAVEAKNDNPNIKVVTSKPKLSKPFRELARPLPVLTPERKAKMAASGEKIPGVDKNSVVPNRGFPFADKYIEMRGDSVKDPVLQTGINARAAKLSSATIGVGFDGMGNVMGIAPPDTNADVGPNHIVQTVNTAVAIWDKAGNQLVAPAAINSLWAGFGGQCENTNRGDPIVLYDSQADRWLISQFAFPGAMNDNYQCIAISQTGDPTGAYHLYGFLYSTTKFNDYPHYGVWTDGYYAGVNQFTSSYAGAGVVAYERDKMLLGQPAQQVIFDLEQSAPDSFTPMPADIDGIFLPPTDMPAIFMEADGVGDMNIWHFDVDWANPQNSTYTFKSTLNVAPWDGAVCGFSRDCIDTPNSQNVDAISHRMMFRLAYRNLNGQSKLVANHTVVGDPGDTNIAGVRWYEINLTEDGTPTVVNNGTFNSGDGNSSWMGSAAMDAVGNIGIGYSVSGPSVHPSIRVTGRAAADPVDTLSLPEMELKAGEASQDGVNRWGDYSSMSIDPVDDCTMWYTTEYFKAEDADSWGWSTYIGSFKFDDCIAGPSGEIAGTVTDSGDSSPIAGALVQIGALTVTTDADGNYSATLPITDVNTKMVPSYEVIVNRYGWNEDSTPGVLVLEDQTTDVDFALDPATPAVVTGTVTDGSGLGHPLYAEITVSAPGATLSTFTDPVTGMYSIDLFEGTLVNISAAAMADGYMSDNADILPENTPVQDFSLLVMASCTADGYEFSVPSFVEDFEGGVPPAGWSVEVAPADTGGQTWTSTTNFSRGNLLGTGEAAAIDSDAAGFGTHTEGTLTSPVISVASLASDNLEFASWYRGFGSDFYQVEISVDGGVWTLVSSLPRTNSAVQNSFDLSAHLAGATDFQLRWNYGGSWAWYALVDDVEIGGGVCIPRAGSIVQGLVADANTSLALNGAMIEAGADSTMSMATPDDANLDDGYFSMFVADAETDVMVSKANYVTATVAKGDVDLTMPIALEAGLLDMAAMLDMDLTMGRMDSSNIALNNTGGADANYTFMLAMMPPAGPVNKNMGPFDPTSRHFGPKALAEVDTAKIRFRSEAPAIAAKADVEVVGIFPMVEAFAWGMGFNQDTNDFWIGDIAVGGAPLDQVSQYDSTGTPTGNVIDNSSFSNEFAADMAYNNRTGMMWQVNVAGGDCIHEMDPVALTVTGNTICPAFGTSQRGLAYDPLTNTFYSGSWNDSIIHQFMTDGTIIRSVNVGLPISGLAINPVTNSLYVMASGSAPLLDVYELDAGTSNLAVIGGFNYPSNQDFTGDGEPDDLLPSGQSGLAIDCDGNLWTPVRYWGVAIGVATGDSSVCDWKELPWLKLINGNSGMIAAMSSDDIAVEFNATEMEVGTYQAQLIATNDTPYGDVTSVVTLNVTAPEYGMLGFSTTSAEARNGESINVTVSRTGGADFAVSVDYFTTDGTAIAGTNYTANSGTLMWADGDTADKTITINTLDTKQKVDRGLSVALTNVQGGASVGTAGAAVVVKRDKKGGGSFGLGILLMLGLAGLARRRKYA